MLYQLLDLVRTSVCANYSECTIWDAMINWSIFVCHQIISIKSVQYTLNFIHSVLAENTKHEQHVWSVTHSWKFQTQKVPSIMYNLTAHKPAVVSGHEELAKFAILKHEVSICRPPEPPPWLWLGWIFILSAGQSQLHALYPFSATKKIMCHRDAHIIQNLV